MKIFRFILIVSLTAFTSKLDGQVVIHLDYDNSGDTIGQQLNANPVEYDSIEFPIKDSADIPDTETKRGQEILEETLTLIYLTHNNGSINYESLPKRSFIITNEKVISPNSLTEKIKFYYVLTASHKKSLPNATTNQYPIKVGSFSLPLDLKHYMRKKNPATCRANGALDRSVNFAGIASITVNGKTNENYGFTPHYLGSGFGPGSKSILKYFYNVNIVSMDLRRYIIS